MIAKGYDGECDYNRREFLYGDGTVLYPDCGSDFMSLFISLYSQHCKLQESKVFYL